MSMGSKQSARSHSRKEEPSSVFRLSWLTIVGKIYGTASDDRGIDIHLHWLA
jgi:hypothetical protein